MSVTDYAIIVTIGILSAVGQYLLKIGLTATMNGAASPGPDGTDHPCR